LAAIDVAREITCAEQVHGLGFCIGGTLLACAAGVLAAEAQHKLASLTLLTTLLDFSDTGEIGLFIDEAHVSARETIIGEGGLLYGRELALMFSALRANDLVWPYVINNYLKGGSPPAFDILFWNEDSTNLPGPMYCWYLRNAYLENKIRTPRGTVQCGVPIDLSNLKMPVYVLATSEDHIVPWRSAYATTGLVGGPTRFVLGASGHIAGVINPLCRNKRSYWVHGDRGLEPDAWLATAREVPGSWWADWSCWLKQHGKAEIPARTQLGSARYRPIEPAPGRYVKMPAE
jgi:polyhydroxyalkanoate synthase subunit PhaC